MKLGFCLPALAAACVVTAGAPALAEEWAVTAGTATSLYETDISTLTVKEEVVHSWMRETLARPVRDAVTHKSYTVSLIQRSDDCQRRQFALGEFIRRDQAGQVVAQGPGGAGWQTVIPGTVAEAIWKTVCATVSPPAEEPLLKSISAGDWRSLGLSADKAYSLSVKSDEIVKLDNGYVLSITRRDYVRPKPIDGFSIRYVVAAEIIDCANEKSAPAGADFYVAPSLWVKAVRIDPKQAQFVPAAPGSFLANNLKEVCAAATPVRANAAEGGEHKGEMFTGTAWGVNKGYLVTASHVIEGAQGILVYNNGKVVGQAKVVLDDPANDLAILQLAKPPPAKLKILVLADHGAVLGRNVFTLGYPQPEALGQHVKMTAGQVSSTAGFQDDARLLQISIPIQPGNSGGPVIAWDGTVVGVVKAKLTRFGDDDEEPVGPENVNYAVKASYVRPMLEDLPDLGDYEAVKGGGSQEQLVSDASAAVFMLLVKK